MPSLDLRYYSKFGKSTIIPLAQVGYNFFKFQYQGFGTTENYEFKSGFGYTFGIGYSYSFTEKGSGLYGAFRFRGLQYKYTDPLLPKKSTSERLNLSIGWRF